MSADLIGAILAAVLTLMIFSYLLGNNPLYRLAQHLFVGVSIGYVSVVVVTTVGYAALKDLTSGPAIALPTAVPVLLGLFMLVRLARPGSGGANLPFLFIAVIAATLALIGVLRGTLIPQTVATMLALNPARPLDLINNLIVVVGVIVTLHYFSFGVRVGGQRTAVGTLVAGAGRWLIIITLGVVLGTLTVSFASALIERVGSFFTLAGF